jgi:hypothetical protein
MQFLGTIDFGGSTVFAYPRDDQPPPPPTIADVFDAEAREKAKREAEREAEREKWRAMNGDERKAWIAEQRARIAEIKRLRELDPAERREFLRRVAAQNGGVIRRRNDNARVISHDDDEVIHFGRTIERPSVEQTERALARHPAHRGERMDDDRTGDAAARYGDQIIDLLAGFVADLRSWNNNTPGRVPYVTERILDDEHADLCKWLAENLFFERAIMASAVAQVVAEIESRCEDRIVTMNATIGELKLALGEVRGELRGMRRDRRRDVA